LRFELIRQIGQPRQKMAFDARDLPQRRSASTQKCNFLADRHGGHK